MADNIELNAGTGGATLATDDVAGVHYQIVKLAVGAADSASLVSNAAPIPVSDAGGSITVDGTFWQATQPVSVATVPSHDVTNAGTFAVQVDGAALTSLQLIDDAVFTDDAAFTPATSKVLAIGFQADETSTDSVDEGDIGAPRMTLDRQIRTVAGVTTAGGTSIFRSLDLDESEEEIKGTAGQVYWIHAINLASSKRYLKFYDATAASVTVGTTTPVLTFVIPTQGDTNGTGFVLTIPMGIPFATAITAAATTGLADADTGAPAANDVVVNIGYA